MGPGRGIACLFNANFHGVLERFLGMWWNLRQKPIAPSFSMDLGDPSHRFSANSVDVQILVIKCRDARFLWSKSWTSTELAENWDLGSSYGICNSPVLCFHRKCHPSPIEPSKTPCFVSQKRCPRHHMRSRPRTKPNESHWVEHLDVKTGLVKGCVIKSWARATFKGFVANTKSANAIHRTNGSV